MENQKVISHIVNRFIELTEELPDNFHDLVETSGTLDLVIRLHSSDETCDRSCEEQFTAELTYDVHTDEMLTESLVRARKHFNEDDDIDFIYPFWKSLEPPFKIVNQE